MADLRKLINLLDLIDEKIEGKKSRHLQQSKILMVTSNVKLQCFILLYELSSGESLAEMAKLMLLYSSSLL
jgi:hypothetical protein